VIDKIAELLQHDKAGDPVHGLKWTRKTTRKVAWQLRKVGIRISANTVRRLLKQMGFSLRVNRKTLESGNKNPPPPRVRNRQFQYIRKKREQFASQQLPILSVDTKKKEMVGNFKNNGTAWATKPYQVNDHDFRNDAKGMAIPYGILDTKTNQGFVVVGTCRETPAFAVDAIALWWKSSGRFFYSHSDQLLILADCGGANNARARAWKYHLQHQLCDPYQLTVTVCHYPPGASKWNPIEHQLFSHISSNWAGIPLESYETVLNYIRTTSNSSGLHVCARLVKKHYEKGERISQTEMDQLALTRHKILPGWNYTVAPSQM
jgi:hypothetical protein